MTRTQGGLRLVPLTQDVVARRLQEDDFVHDCGGERVRFGPSWPGEAYGFFRALADHLAPGETVEGHYVAVLDGPGPGASTAEAVAELGTIGAPEGGCVEVGYGVVPHRRGQGIATAALRELVALLGVRPDVSTLCAETHPGNLASQAVLRRVGFAATGERGVHDGVPTLRWVLPVD